MEIRFNVTGTERKELAREVGQIVGWEPVYKGAPTFAYAVADFLIDKNGTLIGDITQDLLDTLALQGFTSEFTVSDDEVFEAEPEPVGNPRASEAEQQSGYENWSEPATPENAPETPDVPSDDLHAYLPIRADTLVIEIPKDGLTDTSIANLEKLIESKATLIKHALGVESLPVEQTEVTLRFPWFAPGLTPDELDAYTRLIAALCNMAKEQVRVTAKEKAVDNEKYAFRCFLLRLGFIGKGYGSVRKVLLKRLSGNASFKSGERKPSVAAPVAQDGGEASTGEAAAADANAAALAAALADAALIHAVNASFETREDATVNTDE